MVCTNYEQDSQVCNPRFMSKVDSQEGAISGKTEWLSSGKQKTTFTELDSSL